jgi:hypothetical protein
MATSPQDRLRELAARLELARERNTKQRGRIRDGLHEMADHATKFLKGAHPVTQGAERRRAALGRYRARQMAGNIRE